MRKTGAVLNSATAGTVLLSGTFTTALNFTFANLSSGIRDITTGNLTKQIMVTVSYSALSNERKWLGSSSNSIISWTMDFGNNGLKELSASNGAAYTSVENDIMIEDTLTSAISVSAFTVYPTVLMLTSDTDPTPSSNGILNLSIPNPVRIYQNVSESYADFKARMNVWQWGVYTPPTGDIILVARLGNLPADFTYQSLATAAGYSDLGLFIHDRVSEPSAITPAMQAMYNAILGNGNAV